MNDDIVDVYGIFNNKYNRTVRAVEKTMSQYGITRLLTTECKIYFNNLPKTPDKRKDEVLRHMKCSKLPKSEHEVAGKLNDLYVCSEVAKTLESDAIVLAIKKSLKALEDEFPPHGKRQKASSSVIKIESTERKMSKTLVVEERIRKDIDKYSRVGEIKKRLYSMPNYVLNRNRKGVKLPETKLKSPTHSSNLNISKARGLNTKMGRVVVKQAAKRKTIEDMKQMLNPFGNK